jgi:hypothetical protein
MSGQRKISLTIALPGVANSDFREILSKMNLFDYHHYSFPLCGLYMKAFEACQERIFRLLGPPHPALG